MSERHHVTRFAPAAQRQMRAIPLADARKVLLRLGDLQKAMDAGDTSAFDIKAMRGRPGCLRMRVGSYRVVYTAENGDLVIWVLAVGDRKDIYH